MLTAPVQQEALGANRGLSQFNPDSTVRSYISQDERTTQRVLSPNSKEPRHGKPPS